jgi:predicted DCC family thiol-disulfide oxidoreductase YuxK
MLLAMAALTNRIFYDAECGFCRRMLRIVVKWDAAADRRLEPVALQSALAEQQLAPMPREVQLQSWHLQRPDGRIVSGGDAIPELLELVRRHPLVGKAAKAAPKLTDRAYRFVADHRVVFGRLTRRLPDYDPGS